MHEILKFKFNSIIYHLFFDKSFIFVKEVNGVFDYNLTNDEMLLFNKVLIKIKPTKDMIDLGFIKYHNKKFKHLFDITNGFHLFYDDVGSVFKDEDSLDLYIKYNNQESYVASLNNSKDNEKSKKIKRIINIGGNILFVTLVASTLSLNVLLGIKIISDNYGHNQDDLVYSDFGEIEKDLTEDEILDLIDSNPNFSEIEKNIIKSLTDFYIDQLPYLNQIDLRNNLRNGIFVFHKESNGYVKGTWTSIGDEQYHIDIFDSESNHENINEKDLPYITHEAIHMGTKNKVWLSTYRCDAFYEFLTVVFNNEYVGKDIQNYDDSYNWLHNYGYIMLELFEQSTLRQYHADCDATHLIEDLVKTIPDEEMAYKLLNAFDNYHYTYLELINQNSELSYEDRLEDKKYAENQLREFLRLYYEKKYNCKVEDNLYICNYFDKSLVLSVIMDYLGTNDIESLRLKTNDDGIYFNSRIQREPIVVFEVVFLSEVCNQNGEIVKMKMHKDINSNEIQQNKVQVSKAIG